MHEPFPAGPKRDPPLVVDAGLAALAGRQHGVVSIGQLLALGFTHSAVSKRVGRGVLHRVHRGVYAVGHRTLSEEGRWMAAVLAAGEGAALSHLSAAALWRIWRGRAPRPDVLVRRRRRPQPGLRMHLCRGLDARDVTTWRHIPATTVARTLVDLSDVLSAHQLANVMHEAAFRGRLDIEAVSAAMARSNGRRNLGMLAAALELNAVGSAGTRSGPEDDFLSLVHAAGLPEPLVNTTVRAGGRDIEVDFHWPAHRLCVEVDGPGHTRPRTRREDQARDRDLRAAGHEVLRFADVEVRRRGPRVLARVRGVIEG